MRRVGLLGGTFDPIHCGHLDVARAAQRALGLDRVTLIPANLPPHRAAPQASAAHRFAMAAMAVQGSDRLTVSDLEMLSNEPSYTASTLDRLEERGVDTRGLFFVIGADAFAEIALWKAYPAILDRCHFVVVSRPNHPAPALRHTLTSLAGRMIDAPLDGPCNIASQPGIFLVDAPTADVSSTVVRRTIADGQSIASLVPPAVAAHISAHGLYRTRAKDEI